MEIPSWRDFAELEGFSENRSEMKIPRQFQDFWASWERKYSVSQVFLEFFPANDVI